MLTIAAAGVTADDRVKQAFFIVDAVLPLHRGAAYSEQAGRGPGRGNLVVAMVEQGSSVARDAKHAVHGGGALQEQGCGGRVSPISRSRPHGPGRAPVRLELGR